MNKMNQPTNVFFTFPLLSIKNSSILIFISCGFIISSCSVSTNDNMTNTASRLNVIEKQINKINSKEKSLRNNACDFESKKDDISLIILKDGREERLFALKPWLILKGGLLDLSLLQKSWVGKEYIIIESSEKVSVLADADHVDSKNAYWLAVYLNSNYCVVGSKLLNKRSWTMSVPLPRLQPQPSSEAATADVEALPSPGKAEK